jgi:hypothetical protein
VSVFRVFGDRPEVRQVIWSGGAFAVSVTVHGNHAYVLDALDGGSLYGYRIADGHLTPVPGSSRRLGLDPDATPQFTNTPGQVAFTPDGSRIPGHVLIEEAGPNALATFALSGGALTSLGSVTVAGAAGGEGFVAL